MMRTRMLAAVLAASVALPPLAQADENGIGFWLPGFYGSFAAVPTAPGWSFTTVYYHLSVDAGAGQQFPRGGRIDVGVRGGGNLVAFGPTYTFETPLLGAQLSLSLL